MTDTRVVPRVVVVDHDDSYTWNLVHLVAAVTGVLPEVVSHRQVAADDLRRFTHVVLSPGPGHPGEPRDFALGRAVFDLDRPVLGVCLGMQALVVAFGGRVEQGAPAHGELAAIHHDGHGVFAGLPQDFPAVRYHSLRATALPPQLQVTAHCPADPEGGGPVVMGVRHVDLPLQGVQFHPESVLTGHGEALMRNFLVGAA